jgi:hypothetical protein
MLAAPLAAQTFELGLNVSQQTYTRQSVPVGPGHPDPVVFDYDSNTVVAIRAGYALVDVGPALFQLTAAYQPKVETDLKPNGITVPTKLGTEYWAVGAMFQFKAVVAVGAGLDCRFEKATQSNVYSSSQSYTRPWARVNAGYAIPSPLLKPFIGLEVAAPLISKDNRPKLQVGLYGGIRF